MMKNLKSISLLTIIFTTVFFSAFVSAGEKRIEKSFSDKDRIRVKLVLGSCTIVKSGDNKIHVRLVYTYNDESFEPRFRERGHSLYIQEKFRGNNPEGSSNWTIEIPDGISVDVGSATGNLSFKNIDCRLRCNTGTGDIEVSNSRGELRLETGTGMIEVVDSRGEFELSSGTGTITIENSSGNFDASCGTGDIDVSKISISDESNFSSGIGDVYVRMPEGDDYELSISSGTGKAVLDFNGGDVVGYFELKADVGLGRIVLPFNFDKEEELNEGRNRYVIKSFTRKKDTPKFFITTGTGKAELKR